MAKTDGKRWQRLLEHEYTQKLRLQELLEQLAKDQNSLEIQAKKSMHSSGAENPGKININTLLKLLTKVTHRKIVFVVRQDGLCCQTRWSFVVRHDGLLLSYRMVFVHSLNTLDVYQANIINVVLKGRWSP